MVKADYKTKFLKFIQEWKWAFLLISLCIAGIPLAFFYGLQSATWGNEFLANVFSELLGLFLALLLGATFTLLVIDKYLKHHKSLQWKKIKDVTYKSLYFTLSNILLKLNWSFPEDIRVKSYVLSQDIETLNDYLPEVDFNIFVSSLSQIIDKIIEERRSRQNNNSEETDSFADKRLHSALENFKNNSKPDINAISSLIIPRLMNFCEDTILMDDVLELEELFVSLMSKIKHAHKKNGNGHNGVKYIWLLKIQEILMRIRAISNSIQKDIEVD